MFFASFMQTALVLSTIILLIYILMISRYKYWKNKGIFSPEFSFPIGHLKDVFTGKTQMGHQLMKIYENTKNHPYVGLFIFHSKALMINDLDMVKNVLVKDFQYFQDHGLGYSPDRDPLSKHLFNMSGKEWKEMRVRLTPTFTSSKMRYMFNTLLQSSESLIKYLDDYDGKDVDFKETFAKYATDVIGSCAFGIDINTFKEPNGKFREAGRKIFETSFIKSLREAISFYLPSIITTLKIRIVPQEVEDFLVKTVKETVKYREENNVTRNDFLQLLINMKKADDSNSDVKSLELIEITAQVFIFFLAGFETSSTAASFALYELAKNPDVQQKLIAEIDEALAKHDGKITYDCLNNMEYLTQVIEETLRMYPPLPLLFRKCAKDYKIPNTDVVIEKGTFTLIPIMGIQRDDKFHKNPLCFEPERFSPENKRSMNQFSNLPFGEGPRICIGTRFGMMQTRVAIVSVLAKYEVSVGENTLMPMVFEPTTITLMPKGGQYLRLKRRLT